MGLALRYPGLEVHDINFYGVRSSVLKSKSLSSSFSLYYYSIYALITSHPQR